jgi:hypothetical protein
MADRNPPPPFEELPELMLSLRSFGSSRRLPNDSADLHDEQERFFAPLLSGRRTAAQAVTRAQVVAAFDGRRMMAMIDATARSFAAARFPKRAPALRAFEAELTEILEPLRESLDTLRGLAEGVSSGAESPDRWSAWLRQLQAVFRIADASWPPLRHSLASWPRIAGSRGQRDSGGER